MTPNQKANVPYSFNLAGMKPGDWFIGCPACWEQLPVMAAGPLRCAKCGGQNRIFNVTPADNPDIAAANAEAAKLRLDDISPLVPEGKETLP
jgi:hypothetical protein